MDIKAHFNDKLSKILFMEIKSGTKLGNYQIKSNIYVPISSNQIIEKIKEGEDFKKIPIMYFVEGMFYVIGIDNSFRYKDEYLNIIKSIPESIGFIKNKIYQEINQQQFEEGYILLKGLISVEENEENYSKLLLIVDKLRYSNEIFKDEELLIIESAKKFEKLPDSYLYEGLIRRDEGDYVKALYCINTYIEKGGKETKDITELKQNLSYINNFDKAKELSIEDPRAALEILIPLIDVFGNRAELYYHIAVSYRNLANHEKAIYYLNEAIAIDDALVEVVNEFGVNYASLGDYEMAIKYFRKAFEPTKSVEICTNLIMCYMNSGKMEEAKQHLEIAIRLDPSDEVVLELRKILNK